jgi:phosphatidylethanolamine/phosphatidyl-N-methylethanolamine N-methyltransferase
MSIFPEQTETSRALYADRQQTDRRLAFLREFLRSPRQIGSIVPSSRFLEQRLVDVSGAANARVLVEFGPGTGGTTRAFLRALPGSARLLAIEINPRFASHLESLADPRLMVHAGSALDIREALATCGLPLPDVVLSGIPFSTMPPTAGRGILRAVWAALAPGGRFVAYQFRDAVAVLGRDILGTPEVSLELLNVPPMRVYCWRKPAGGAYAAASHQLTGNR